MRQAASGEGGLPPGRRRLAVAAILLSTLMSVLLGSIVNLALPVMAEALEVTAAQVVWVVTAYQLALLASLLPCGALGEAIGYHRVFLFGLAGMAVTGVVCALADSLPVLVAARALQGVAAAAVMGLTGALLRHAFPPAALGRAIGLNAMTVALGGTLGPGLGALVLSLGSWHWVFAVTLPFALVAGLVGVPTLPRVAGTGRRFDMRGAALNALAFGLLLTGAGWLVLELWLGLCLVAGGAVALWLLVRQQRGKAQPLLPIDLLALPSMGIVLSASVCGFAAQMLGFVVLPFLMDHGWGFSTALSGALLLLWPLAVGALAPVAGRLADRHDTAILCAAGSGVLGMGLIALSVVPGAAAPWLAAAAIMLCGVGFGLFQTPNMRAILGAAPLSRSGGAGGMQATARLFGQSVGTVGAAILFQLLPGSASLVSLRVAAALAAIACLLSLARWRRGTTR
ncbi:MFS transporter [Roseomonas sp. AR75]|uniref:MFS transporter n=1 Tax=Roseomonas sp. AR75 TaxID=2562311 RepID=UPI001484D755|nr:MFS transporter [Roseomonas sp. AR75]